MTIFSEALRALGDPNPLPPPAPPMAPQAPSGDQDLSLMEGLQFCMTDSKDPDLQMICAAYMVSEPDDPQCPDHLVMLTQEGCPWCDQAKQRFGHLVEQKLVVDLDVHSERGQKLARASGIDYTPGLLVVGCDERVRAILDNPLHPRLAWREDTGLQKDEDLEGQEGLEEPAENEQEDLEGPKGPEREEVNA